MSSVFSIQRGQIFAKKAKKVIEEEDKETVEESLSCYATFINFDGKYFIIKIDNYSENKNKKQEKEISFSFFDELRVNDSVTKQGKEALTLDEISQFFKRNKEEIVLLEDKIKVISKEQQSPKLFFKQKPINLDMDMAEFVNQS